MVKKIVKAVLKIILIIISYILQIYIFNSINFFGVNGDLCLSLVALVTLMDKKWVAYVTATVCGIMSDILFSNVICKYLLIYIIVVSVLVELKKIYKQDSKLAVIVFSTVAVGISELISFLFNVLITGQFINIFVFVLNIFKECLISVFLAFLLYLVFKLIRKGE